MGIAIFLLVGLLAGLIAGRLIEGHGFGIVGDVVIGIIGALVGGFIFDAFGYPQVGFWSTLGTSIVGAMIFLYIANLFPRSSGPSTPKHFKP